MKAEFTVCEDDPGYWFVPHAQAAAALADPRMFRGEMFPTKIAACRAALSVAIASGACELHLHGAGSTTTIKKEAKESGLKPFVYWPSASTRIAPVRRLSQRESSAAPLLH